MYIDKSVLILVMMVMDGFKNNCEVVMVEHLSSLYVHPKYFSVVVYFIYPNILNVRVGVFLLESVLEVVVHVFKVTVEVVIDNVDSVTHSKISNIIRYFLYQCFYILLFNNPVCYSCIKFIFIILSDPSFVYFYLIFL